MGRFTVVGSRRIMGWLATGIMAGATVGMAATAIL